MVIYRLAFVFFCLTEPAFAVRQALIGTDLTDFYRFMVIEPVFAIRYGSHSLLLVPGNIQCLILDFQIMELKLSGKEMKFMVEKRSMAH